MAFFHGVETQYIDSAPRSVQTVPTNVIFLVGAAPIYKASNSGGLNSLALTINNVEDVEVWGAKTDGFNIPYWLDVLRDYGAGQIITINVFDPATDTAVDTDEAYTFPTSGASIDIIQLKRGGAAGTANAENLTAVTINGTGGTPTYVEDTDYTVDAINGTITRLDSGSITAGASIEATYTYADPSAIVAADVIGSVVDQTRTGLEAIADIYSLFGVTAKVICALLSEDPAVVAELESKATLYEAIAGIDAPQGSTRAEVIAGRAGTAPVGHFQTANDRIVPCYPWVYNSDNILIPMSVHLAGCIAFTDSNFGYWWSPSNKDMFNAVSLETNLSANFRDPNTDVNLLNAQGIYTANFERGQKVTWGNRNASFPTDSDILTFIAVRRNLDITLESSALACRPFVDRPIKDVLVDQVLDTLNGYIRSNVVIQAMAEGSRFYYDQSRNPPTQLAGGKIVFSYEFGFPPPAEHIVLQGTININLLANIGGTSGS